MITTGMQLALLGGAMVSGGVVGFTTATTGVPAGGVGRTAAVLADGTEGALVGAAAGAAFAAGAFFGAAAGFALAAGTVLAAGAALARAGLATGLAETVFLALVGLADGFLAGIYATPGHSEGRGIIQTVGRGSTRVSGPFRDGSEPVRTASPVLCQPIKHGAAITMHSTTKYIGGHGTSIGGIIVDGGNFDWEKHADRFPMLNTPDPSYHGAVWTQAVKPIGPVAYIIKARVTLLRDIGAAMSPFNAFMFIQGLETLALRMRQHCQNASAVAAYLAKHPKVTKVIHPGLMAGEAKRRADAYLKGGYGGLIGFELKGGKDAGRAFIGKLGMFYHVANIGDARSLAIHPATTTHSQLTPAEQAQTGVTDGYVRLSIGIEHADDIIADLDQALAAV